MGKISIIIVNYNSGDFLKQCLKSIQSSVKCNYEVIIVDNASKDNSFYECRKLFGDNINFKFISAGGNLGFAKANNLGVENSNGNIIHFLNPDTELSQEITFDYQFIQDNPNLVGINKLRNPDGTIVKSDHLIPTLENYIKAIFGKGYRWYIGASVIISRDNFYKIKKWNEQYFMYYEDLDLFYQIAKNKIKCKILPSIIMHIGGGCSSNVWSNKERLNRVTEAEKKFYKINNIAWEYPIIKCISTIQKQYKALIKRNL